MVLHQLGAPPLLLLADYCDVTGTAQAEETGPGMGSSNQRKALVGQMMGMGADANASQIVLVDGQPVSVTRGCLARLAHSSCLQIAMLASHASTFSRCSTSCTCSTRHLTWPYNDTCTCTCSCCP